MGWTGLSVASPTARKTHRCDWCGESIDKGLRYLTCTGVMDGVMQRSKLHVECNEAMQRDIDASSVCNGDYMFNLYSNVRGKCEGDD